MSNTKYWLAWSCVDGAGSEPLNVTNEQAAIEAANQSQANAEQNGNVWGYTYKVRRDEGRTLDEVYNARTGKRS